MITRRNFQTATLLSLFGGSLAGTSAASTSGTAVQSNLAEYRVQDVSFPSMGETLVGKLLQPVSPGPHAAVVVMGPVAFVKEQSPLQYATRLAARGLSVLIFDPRYHGASSGHPRRMESGRAKVEDLRAALDFLASQDRIDQNNLHLLGICQGVNWTIEAATQDERIKSLGIVAGHYLTPETANMYLGDQKAVAARLKRSADAKVKFMETGKVDYIPIVGSTDALLVHTASADWYLPWENHAPWLNYRGGWENRITAMSEGEIWNHRIDQSVANLKVPVLMVHGDDAATGPDIPRKIFEKIASKDKKLQWVNGANQLQFYEDPMVNDSVVANLAPHYLRNALAN